MNLNLYAPTLQVRSKTILLYNQYTGQRNGKIIRSQNRYNVNQHATYAGQITQHSKKRIARAISLLNQMSPWKKVLSPFSKKLIDFKLSFMTLTIPDNTYIEGKAAYQRLLKPFLRKMKNKYGLNSYVWKAELQQRGQIHYHITSNCYIPYSAIQQEWNNIIRKEGLMDEFITKHGHDNPHSTEIKSVKNVSNIEAYLVKYVCKEDEQGRTISGKIWGCSDNLKGASYFSDIVCKANEVAINAVIKAKKAVFKQMERFGIIEFLEGSPLSVLSQVQLSSYKEYIRGLAIFVPT